MRYENVRTVNTIRVSGWDHMIPPAYAGGTDLSSLEIARPALRLLGGSFGIVGCRDEFLGHRLRIIVIAAELHSLLVLVNGLGAIALSVVGVAAFDARPGIDPLRLATDRIQCCLEIIEGHLPVLLFEINQAKIVVDPGVVAIQLER